MKTVLICSRCGCGVVGLSQDLNGWPHDGPLWQWPGGNQFGQRCGGIIEARIISGANGNGMASAGLDRTTLQ